MKTLYLLVDCNSFFVSAERVFSLEARKKPTVVLSNNDGCVVAKSYDLKDLGVKTGQPYFACKDILDSADAKVFSSNFQLYADMSHRVMSILHSMCNHVEIYSIDEAFLSLVDEPYPARFARYLRRRIMQETDIPVSIGIAQTKTLAKAASEIAKEHPSWKGVCDFSILDEEEQDTQLSLLAVGEIWGIGRKSAIHLNNRGIYNAKELKHTNAKQIKSVLHLPGERIVLELNNVPCLSMEDHTIKKGILSSRSFSSTITDKESLHEALADYAARASEKLRSQRSLVQTISIYIRTNRFHDLNSYYIGKSSRHLPYPTAHTPTILYHIKKMLQEVYKKGYRYKKAGIYFSNLIQENGMQPDLFGERSSTGFYKEKELMRSVDMINAIYGNGTIIFASQGIHKAWKMKQDYRSSRYTTDWNEILTVN